LTLAVIIAMTLPSFGGTSGTGAPGLARAGVDDGEQVDQAGDLQRTDHGSGGGNQPESDVAVAGQLLGIVTQPQSAMNRAPTQLFPPAAYLSGYLSRR
jgi:hypothetical protein